MLLLKRFTVEQHHQQPKSSLETTNRINCEDYKTFYRCTLMQFEEPLFHIHLNVDYPFNLTGISQNGIWFTNSEEKNSVVPKPSVRNG
jgi:HSP90 family molecular chaperone